MLTQRTMILTVLVTAVLAEPAHAAEHYVSPSGSDSNPGTQAAPFRTIQRAANLVNPGDTVIVEDGTYVYGGANACGSYKSIVCVTRGGTASQPVTFKARNTWGAKLDGQNGTAFCGWNFTGGVGYVRVEGFEIFGLHNNGSADAFELYNGGHDVQIVGNHLHTIGKLCTDTNNAQAGIFLQWPNVLIEGNVFHDIGRFAAGEQGCTSANGYYQNHDHGIYVDGNTDSTAPGAKNVTIRNNVFYKINRGWPIQLYPGTLSNIKILNNTFATPNPYRAGHIETCCGVTLADSAIKNNVFYQPTTSALFLDSTLTITNTVIANNITTAAAMSNVTPPSGFTWSNNRVNTDPLLVNPGGGDYHLQAGSPALDTGLTLSEVPTDLEGVARPQGTGYDLGAYERLTSAPAPVQVAPPTITPNGGTFTGAVEVSLSCATSGATIRYTTTGSDPTTSSALYMGPITLLNSTTLKAKAFADGMTDSAVATATFTIQAAPPPPPEPTNQAPTVSAGSDQSITLPAMASLSGTVSDDGLPSGSSVTTTWSMVSGPGPVTFANAAAQQTTAGFSATGTYVLRLTASDGALSAFDEVTILVNAKLNTPPVAQLTVTPTSGVAPLPVTADARASSDAEGPLASTISFGDGGQASGPIATHTYSQPGSYTVQLTVMDTAGATATAQATVTVQAPAPVADTTKPTVSLTAPQPGQFVAVRSVVTLAATATDDVGVAKVQFFVNGNLKCTDTTAPYTCAWTVPKRAWRTYTLKAKASDAAGNVTTSASVGVISK